MTLTQSSNLILLDQPNDPILGALAPFAATDLFIRQADKLHHSFIHFWQTEPTVILGMKDTRLPFLKDGLTVFKNAQYDFLARNSGGLAVVSDDGILNFSFIIPNDPNNKKSVPDAYEMMKEIISIAFSDFKLPIEAKEIVQSYCPGDYDLSIHDKKFAGISQRRIGNGIAVMIYLSVSGTQNDRGELVKQFYKEGLKEDFGTNGYPDLDPSSMATLSDLFQTDLTTDNVKARLIAASEFVFKANVAPYSFQAYLDETNTYDDFQKFVANMQKRNLPITDLTEGN